MMEYEGAYTMTFLGSTDRYDVSDLVLYPGIIEDAQAIAACKAQLFDNVYRAKANGRKMWIMVDLSQLTAQQRIGIAYRFVLPFVRTPMIAKTYGVTPLTAPEADKDWGILQQIMRVAFRHAVMPSRAAALPPGFVPLEQEQPKGKNAS